MQKAIFRCKVFSVNISPSTLKGICCFSYYCLYFLFPLHGKNELVLLVELHEVMDIGKHTLHPHT